MKTLLRLLYLLGSLYWIPGWASIDTYTFSDPEQEALYRELIQELRCLVCQNQNIADSNAELAKDLRRKTYEMVKKGQSKEEIVGFMVARYGDFVMYKPPFKASTVILWLGPGIIFVIGIVVLVRMVRRRSQKAEPLLSEAERQRAEQLLAGAMSAKSNNPDSEDKT